MKAFSLVIWAYVTRWFSSLKVQTTLAGLIVSYAAKRGLNVSTETALAILGLFGLLVHAQGQADHGKVAAQIAASSSTQSTVKEVTTAPPTPSNPSGTIEKLTVATTESTAQPLPPANATPIPTKRLALPAFAFAFGSVFAIAFIASSSCVGAGNAIKGEGKVALDCVNAEAKQAIVTYGPTALDAVVNAVEGNGQIATDKLKGVFASYATDAAKCVAFDALAKLLKNQSSGSGAAAAANLNVDPTAAHAAIEELRAQLAPGRAVQLESGPL